MDPLKRAEQYNFQIQIGDGLKTVVSTLVLIVIVLAIYIQIVLGMVSFSIVVRTLLALWRLLGCLVWRALRLCVQAF